jgi:hypothetical protein
MLITILLVVIALVSWALHLMQEAYEQREFSLMLAGALVATSAAALVGVYFVMGNYMGYVSQIEDDAASQEAYESVVRYLQQEDLVRSQAYMQSTSSPVLSEVRTVERSVR